MSGDRRNRSLRVHRAPQQAHPITLGLIAGLVCGALITLLVVTLTSVEGRESNARGRNEIASNGNVQGRIYAGDPTDEARLVQAEDYRILDIRSSSAGRKGSDALGPYRLPGDPTTTLVLPARATAYTLADLRVLAPTTLVARQGGSYLLTENIVVLTGATLDLSSAPGLRLLLSSTPDAFVSIVAIGGTLKLGGDRNDPALISSFDSNTGLRDLTTDDGRAYIRAIGGQALFSHVHFAHLGFWSGNTGGVALTGTDGEEETDTVSASIDNITVNGDAFGLFVTHATNVTIRDSTIRNSLVDGLVLHRFVTDSSVKRTSSTDNAVDGFTLGRSSVEVAFSDITASENGRNGLSLDGQPLADGPSAIGTPVDVYGDNSVTRATLINNKRYGIEVSGGRDITINSSTFEGNDIGIVLSHGADAVTISGATLRSQTRQGIAVRDNVEHARIRDSTISGGETGVYVRNADATVTSSRITNASRHGVTLVGDTVGVRVTGNSIAGHGPAAVWMPDAGGGTVENNDLLGWHPTPTVASVLRSLFQPLTVVWLLLGILLVATALTRRGGQYGAFRDPYAERVPLTSLSKGIVSRDSIDGEQ